jgi:hypothetical protein
VPYAPDTKRDLEPFVDEKGQIREDVFEQAVTADEFVARIRKGLDQ